MSFVPDRSQLRGLSFEQASCFGMPHLGAFYARDDIHANRLEKGAVCACCGAIATNSHHEPQISLGGGKKAFLLQTDNGSFKLKPALIALCGSGTTGCHGMRHNGMLSICWHWQNDEAAEAWFSGWALSHGYEPHSEKLYELGDWKLIRRWKTVNGTYSGRDIYRLNAYLFRDRMESAKSRQEG